MYQVALLSQYYKAQLSTSVPKMTRSVLGWLLTYPQNLTPKEVLMEKLIALGIMEAIVCEEKHEDGSPHLHAYVKLNEGVTKKQSVHTFNLIGKSGDYQPARSWKACQEYVKKDGNYISHNIEVESAVQKKAKRSRQILEDDIDNLIDTGVISSTQIYQVKKSRLAYEEMKQAPYSHDDVRGHWYYGPSGTGKSRKAYTENPGAYLKAQNKWFDGYTGQDVIILDDLDSTTLGHYLKIWADRYPCSGEVKCGNVQLRHKKFIVTSNWSIEELFKDEPKMIEPIKRRFKEEFFPSFPNTSFRDNDPNFLSFENTCPILDK